MNVADHAIARSGRKPNETQTPKAIGGMEFEP